MCNSKCGSSCGGCIPAMIGKTLLIIGGINWGLVGVGMLMGSDWNVVHMLVGNWSTLEAIVYVLVGVGAVMKIFCCRCKKCTSCKDGVCNDESAEKSM